MKRGCIYLSAVLLLVSVSGAQAPRLIPVEEFFRNPQQAGFEFSPDGSHYLFLQPWETRLNVHVQRIGDTAVTRVTSSIDRDILFAGWASNERIVYIQDKDGDENWHLYSVARDGSDHKELTPYDSVMVRLVDMLVDVDDEMLISINRRDRRVFDVYRINVATGEMKLVAENPGNITSWIADHDGKVRVAYFTDGVNTGFMYREAEEDTFEKVVELSFRETLDPMFFTYDNRNLYVRSNVGRDKEAVYIYDMERRELGELVLEHPEVDVAGLLRSRKRRKVTGAYYYLDKRQYEFFDEWRARVQRDIDSLLPGYDAFLTDLSRDETKAMVRTYSDRSRGAYYYFDTETREMQKLVDLSPWLKEDELAPMEPVAFRSRDGLTIHSYLTLPLGVEPVNLPAVMVVHGGPWVRDVWGYDSEAQLLANRGYAVLQVNYRGSTGYGKAFWQASFKEWGRKMQDDITDGVKWLTAQGIADSTRVGIYGASYGGYAVLAGLAFTPDLYACGVDYVGVSNIFTDLANIPPYWEPYRAMQYEMVGDPVKDSVLLYEASPVFHADRIKAPLFVAQGATDPRVKKSESDQIVEALKKRGIEVPYMVKGNEGHGFRNDENQFDFYRAVERFLARHLGGRTQRAPGEE